MGMMSDAPLAHVAGSTLEHSGHLPQRFVPRGSAWELLTDLQGLEEEHGDMHIAIAGTRAGLTAMQLDCSVQGVPLKAVEAAILAARNPRMQILDRMEQAAAQVSIWSSMHEAAYSSCHEVASTWMHNKFTYQQGSFLAAMGMSECLDCSDLALMTHLPHRESLQRQVRCLAAQKLPRNILGA